MSNYTLITKENFSLNASYPFSLYEYMLFNHETDAEKFIILKFLHHDYDVHFVEFEITEYNAQDEAIASSVYQLTDLNPNPSETRIPIEKYLVNENCVRITYKLIKAQSADKEWLDGGWLIDEVNEEVIEQLIPSSIQKITYRNIKFPYVISVALVALFMLFVILVFNALNT